MIKVNLRGDIKEVPKNSTVLDVAKGISEGLSRVTVAGKVDGQVVDIRFIKC